MRTRRVEIRGRWMSVTVSAPQMVAYGDVVGMLPRSWSDPLPHHVRSMVNRQVFVPVAALVEAAETDRIDEQCKKRLVEIVGQLSIQSVREGATV